MKILRALVLVLTLSVCAYAGNMDNGAPVPPPPAPPTTGGSTETTGDGAAVPQATETAITDIALSLLQSVLSVI